MFFGYLTDRLGRRKLFLVTLATYSLVTLIATGSQIKIAMGYALGAALMLGGAICEHLIGVEAAGKSLESISKPLQSSS